MCHEHGRVCNGWIKFEVELESTGKEQGQAASQSSEYLSRLAEATLHGETPLAQGLSYNTRTHTSCATDQSEG